MSQLSNKTETINNLLTDFQQLNKLDQKNLNFKYFSWFLEKFIIWFKHYNSHDEICRNKKNKRKLYRACTLSYKILKLAFRYKNISISIEDEKKHTENIEKFN